MRIREGKVVNVRTFTDKVLNTDPDLSKQDIDLIGCMSTSNKLESMVLAYYLANMVNILERVEKLLGGKRKKRGKNKIMIEKKDKTDAIDGSIQNTGESAAL